MIENITLNLTNMTYGAIPVGTTMIDAVNNRDCVNFTNEVMRDLVVNTYAKLVIPALLILLGFTLYYTGVIKDNERFKEMGFRSIKFGAGVFLIMFVFKMVVYGLGLGVPIYE